MTEGEQVSRECNREGGEGSDDPKTVLIVERHHEDNDGDGEDLGNELVVGHGLGKGGLCD